jgi:hypothetical protein
VRQPHETIEGRPRGDVMEQQSRALRDFFVRRSIRQARIAKKKRERASRHEVPANKT